MTAAVRARVEIGLGLMAIYAACFAILGSAMAARAPQVISGAVMFDLTITSAALVWWRGVRRGQVRWRAVVTTIGAGLLIVRAAVPHAPVSAAAVASLLIDGGLLVAVAFGVRGVFPPVLVELFRTEIAIIGHALTGWFRRAPAGAFSVHRRNGWWAVVGLLVFLTAGETVALHIALGMWSHTAAWIATALSIYSVIWLIGDAHALRLRPIVIDGDIVHVRIGVRWQVSVAREDILSIEPITSVPDGAVRLTVLEPTLLVTLRSPVTARGMLGRTRTGDRLALTVDDPAAFTAAAAPRA